MKILIEMTNETFELNGLKFRRWYGTTERGTLCDVIVQSVRPNSDEDLAALAEEFGFEATLQPVLRKD